MERVDKACPVVTRRHNGTLEVLAFAHPLAGHQLVKGTVECGESPEQAALRELSEESGIGSATIERSLGTVDLDDGDVGQRWHLVQCDAGELPEGWVHHTDDDGGHDFRFFWHRLAEQPTDAWRPLFKRALSALRQRLP